MLTKWILILVVAGWNAKGDLIPQRMEWDPGYDLESKSDCYNEGVRVARNNPLVQHFTCNSLYDRKDLCNAIAFTLME